MTIDEYAGVCARWVALWPHSKLVAETFQAGEPLLLDLPAGPVHAALEVMSVDGDEFAPSPGKIRRRALELMGQGAPDVDQAMAEVFAAVSRLGVGRTPEWSHPAVGEAVAAVGGWSFVCNSTNQDALRAHLMRAYEPAAARAHRQAFMPPAVAALVGNLDLSLERTGPDGPPLRALPRP